MKGTWWELAAILGTELAVAVGVSVLVGALMEPSDGRTILLVLMGGVIVMCGMPFTGKWAATRVDRADR